MRYLLAIPFAILIAVQAQVMLPHRRGVVSVVAIDTNIPCTCTPQTAPTQSLILRWSFDQGSGNVINDDSGSSNRLLNFGGTYVSHGAGYAMQLAGTNFAFLRTAGDVNFGTNLITVTFLLKRSYSNDYEEIFTSSDNNYRTSATNTLEIGTVNLASNTVSANIFQDESGKRRAENFAGPVTNAWSGVAAIFDNTTIDGDTKMFFCNEEQAVILWDATKTTAGNFDNTRVYLGRWGILDQSVATNQYYPLTATIDDVRVYSGELNNEQICYVFSHYADGVTNSPAITLTNGLVSFWPLEDLAGTRYDFWGTNHFTEYATTLATNAMVQNGIYFASGTTNNFKCAAGSGTSWVTNDFTVSLWACTTGSGSNLLCFVKRDDTHNDLNLFYYKTDGKFYFGVAEGAKSVESDAVSLSTWYHVVAWLDSTADKIYIQLNNGTTNSTALAGARSGNNTAPLVLGSNNLTPPTYGIGWVDEIMVWNRTLTAAERAYLYNSGRGRSVP